MVYYVLEISHGSSANLLCLSKSKIYIFDPHSESMTGKPVSNELLLCYISFQEQK